MDMVRQRSAQCALHASAGDAHKSMGSTNLSSINGAIASSLEDGEILGVLRVQNKAIDRRLGCLQYWNKVPTHATYPDDVHVVSVL